MATAEAIDVAAATPRRYHCEHGLGDKPSAILAPLTDAFGPDQYAATEAAGVTHVLTMPWMFYSGSDATLERKIEGMRRFRHEHYPAALGLAPGDHIRPWHARHESTDWFRTDDSGIGAVEPPPISVGIDISRSATWLRRIVASALAAHRSHAISAAPKTA